MGLPYPAAAEPSVVAEPQLPSEYVPPVFRGRWSDDGSCWDTADEVLSDHQYEGRGAASGGDGWARSKIPSRAAAAGERVFSDDQLLNVTTILERYGCSKTCSKQLQCLCSSEEKHSRRRSSTLQQLNQGRRLSVECANAICDTLITSSATHSAVPLMTEYQVVRDINTIYHKLTPPASQAHRDLANLVYR